jgi:hypothetical protein
MTDGACPECGLNLGLVGRNHLCRPRAVVEDGTNSPEAPETNTDLSDGTNAERDRKRRWRAANADKYRDYQRAYMARRRALSTGE